jgi:hypothetical protein
LRTDAGSRWAPRFMAFVRSRRDRAQALAPCDTLALTA